MVIRAIRRIPLVFLLCLLFIGESQAKEWRGIVPLKSTRADVERLFGKENSRGRYDFEDEFARVFYRENPCMGVYRPLEKDNSECLVSMDTVVSIHVTLEVTRRFTSLHLDKANYKRTPLHLPEFADYSNLDEGVIYTVDESSDDIIDIEYVPSETDCRDLIARNSSQSRNSYRGLVPLHSNRTDVERLFGPPFKSGDSYYVYETDYESVTVHYSTGVCKSGENEWNVPAGVTTEFVVNALPPFETRYLRLDPKRFAREEERVPETPYKQVTYTDEANGVLVRAKNDGHAETVVSVTYSPSRKDEKLRCEAGKRSSMMKPERRQ